MVAVWALCAETDEEAVRLASSSRMAFAHLLSGNPIQVPRVEASLAFLEANAHLLDSIITRRRAIIGNPRLVREKLEEVAVEYGADEVMVVTITYDHAARVRSYELLADAFGLTGE
jgi:alkanesulfonate monooxygenase SsuD/methylene tetrahydromethanopterin reductase-like flavin-dependent oxidoreductase (luciferase family)